MERSWCPARPIPTIPSEPPGPNGEAGVVASSDGGRTFGSFHRVGIVHRALYREMYAARIRGDALLSGNFMQGPSFAVAPMGAKVRGPHLRRVAGRGFEQARHRGYSPRGRRIAVPPGALPLR